MTQISTPINDAKKLTWTKEEFEDISKDFLQRAREVFVRDSRHVPMVFLFCTKDPRTGEDAANILPILAQFSTAEEKEMFALTVKKLAELTKSVGLIFISEIWVRTEAAPPGLQDRNPDRLREYMRQQKPPSECADRTESLMLSFEHTRFGAKVCSAEITRDAQGHPTLHDWKWFDGRHTGRFMHLLPRVD